MTGEGKGEDSTSITKFRADNCKVRLITNELNPEIANANLETEEFNTQTLKITS